jgi:hypothetical protein
MKRHTHHRPGLAASVGTLLLALVVFSGAFDQLPARGCRLVFDSAGNALNPSTAIHRGQGLHFGRATVAKRAWSPIGLHRTRTKVADLCRTVSLARPELRSFLPAPPDLASGGAAHRTAGARAPPIA